MRKRGNSKKRGNLVLKRKKYETSQAAMEFMMTYGWAMIVLIIAIASLAYFGVLNPSRFLPDQCILPAGLACLDFNVYSDNVEIVLRNSFGETITIEQIDVDKDGGGSCSYIPVPATDLKDHEKRIFTVQPCINGEPGGKFLGELSVTYTLEDKLTHVVNGKLVSRIDAG